jgi:hypothetical protein
MVCTYLHYSFSPFLLTTSFLDGRQVRRPSWIWATSLCYILLNKLVALVGSGRRTCHPSRDEIGLKDWANTLLNPRENDCSYVSPNLGKLFFFVVPQGPGDLYRDTIST